MLISLIWLMFKKRDSTARNKLRWFALTFSTVFLFSTYANKTYVDAIFESELKRQEIPYLRYFSKPTPLNQVLWNVTAETEDAYYLAYYSHFDQSKKVTFNTIQKNLHLLGSLAENKHIQYLIKTIDGYYSIEKQPDRLIVHDLRFGQAATLDGLKPHIVLSYHLIPNQPGDFSSFTVEQVRNDEFNPKEALGQLWKRIKGV